jgi:hypothetical protein
MSVKILKLITGEELLAKVLPSSTNVIKMENPVRIVVMPNKLDPKTPNVGFAPWAEFSDDKIFEIDKSHVLAIITPISQFTTQYSSMFSGLVLPTSNLLVPGA